MVNTCVRLRKKTHVDRSRQRRYAHRLLMKTLSQATL